MSEIILDPETLAPGRTELSLAEEGLEVAVDDADWGESTVELAQVRQDIGEIPSDRHLPNVEMTVPLIVREDGETSVAQALANLQRKVGLWQREGGWIQRDFSDDGGFAGSVAYRVHSASLSGVQGWLLAHRQVAEGVVLKVVRSPLAYALTEDESEEVKEESARELVYTLSDVKGTAEGLRRIIVENLNESGDWRGLIWAEESRDYSSAETAKLAYEAEALTPKGGAAKATLSGASGGATNNVIQHASLTAGFLTVLSSEISGVGHMTHRGPRRIVIRGYDPGSESDHCELRLRWRALGASRWETNAIKPVPLTDGFFLLDLGGARPEAAVLGDDRWEFQIQGRAIDGSGTIRLDKVYVLPTEQYLMLRAPDESQGADAQSTRSPGTVESKLFDVTAPVEVIEWTNESNAKSSDGSYAAASGLLSGAAVPSEYLAATNFGFALPEGAVPTGVILSVERQGTSETVRDYAVKLIKGGSVTGSDNKASPVYWPKSTDGTAIYGAADDLWGLTLTAGDVNSSSFGAGIAAQAIIAGGARVDHITLTVYYTEADDPNRICFAERSIELRSDGCFRQDSEDDVWGREVPEGFLPYAAPSGLEGRTSRGILIPTRGDLDSLPDAESNKLAAVIKTRAGYHFAREAAA